MACTRVRLLLPICAYSGGGGTLTLLTFLHRYETGSGISAHSSLIHEYYERLTLKPIHVVIDTTITTHALPITAYVSVPFGVGETTSGLFVPVACQTSLPDADRVACGS